MKLKISSKKIYYFIFIVSLIIVIFNILHYFWPVYSVTYKGRIFTFRGNIKATKNIPVLDDKIYIHNLIWNPYTRTVKILFQPNVTNMGYYSVEAYELTNKLRAIYILNNIDKNFTAEPIESYDNIEPTNELKIVLIHPDLTNETYIKAKENIIYIAGKNLKDFDLAVIETILIAMNYDM